MSRQEIEERIQAVFGADVDPAVADMLRRDLEGKWAKREEKRRELVSAMTEVRELVLTDSVYETKDIKKFHAKFRDYFFKRKQNDNALQVVRDMAKSVEVKKYPQPLYNIKTLPTLHKSSNGLDKGMYVFGADSNVGKTALLIQLAVDLLINNDKAKILFLSPDDTTIKITRRFISCLTFIVGGGELNAVPIYFAQNYYTHKDGVGNYQRNPDVAKCRDGAYKVLEELLISKRLKIISGRVSMNDIEAELEENKQNILIADASYKIDCEGRSLSEKDEIRPGELKNITVAYNISSVCVKDGRKTQSRGSEVKMSGEQISMAMGKGDLRGSALWNYEPDMIINLWNDSGDVIFSIQKNKIGSMKKTSRLKLHAEYSAYQETIDYDL